MNNADLTPQRLFQHVQNLQRQVNSLALICLELKSSLRRCGVCKTFKSLDSFHRGNSYVCKRCKSKEDRRIYRERKENGTL